MWIRLSLSLPDAGDLPANFLPGIFHRATALFTMIKDIARSVLVALLLVSSLEVAMLHRQSATASITDTVKLHEASVMVKTAGGSGSGTIFKDRYGRLLVLTAYHVVENEKDIKLVQGIVLAGQKLSEVYIDADVIEFSEKYDLALLAPRSTRAFKEYVNSRAGYAKLYKGEKIHGAASPVIHVGSMRGEVGERSVTFGHVAGLAREISAGVFLDQATSAAAPGSSGGGIFDAHTGELIGVLTRGISDSFLFFVPVRDINQWLWETKN